jgi:hypothetical protein
LLKPWQIIDARLPIPDRVVKVFTVLVICVSTGLAFWQLDLMGLTWDEDGDYHLASDFYRDWDLLSNHEDPSQGRLAHLIAAVFFTVFGKSYFVFKLPFVIIGLASGFMLWRLLRRHVNVNVARLITALYFCCPYVLAAERTAATAGDVLLVALTLAFIGTLYGWVTSDRFWPYGALCAAVCGAAAGAKWTSGLLLVIAIFYQVAHMARSRRTLLNRRRWTELLASITIAAAVAIIASPTFLNGLPFIIEAIKDSRSYDDLHMLYFGEVRLRPPWYYIPALAVSKFTPPVALVFAWACGQAVRTRLRTGSWGTLRAICLLSLIPIAPLAIKSFQNAHYYVSSIPAVFVLTALTIDDWLKNGSPFRGNLVLVSTAAAVVYQLILCGWLAPDFLQAGREYGSRFRGQFGGPAVNHCQGSPLALREINRLVVSEGPNTVYQLDSCIALMEHAVKHGPVPAAVRISKYPAKRPSRPHYLMINASFIYDSTNGDEYRAALRRKREATRDCNLVVTHSDFKIYRCDTAGR